MIGNIVLGKEIPELKGYKVSEVEPNGRYRDKEYRGPEKVYGRRLLQFLFKKGRGKKEKYYRLCHKEVVWKLFQPLQEKRVYDREEE